MAIFSKEPEIEPPNKTQRRECWKARDSFFECLDANNISDSLDPNEKANVESKCGKLRAHFERNCIHSWYDYFQKKRYGDISRKKFIDKLESEGAKPLPFKLSRDQVAEANKKK